MFDPSFGKAVVGMLWLAAVIIAVVGVAIGLLVGWWLL